MYWSIRRQTAAKNNDNKTLIIVIEESFFLTNPQSNKNVWNKIQRKKTRYRIFFLTM